MQEAVYVENTSEKPITESKPGWGTITIPALDRVEVFAETREHKIGKDIFKTTVQTARQVAESIVADYGLAGDKNPLRVVVVGESDLQSDLKGTISAVLGSSIEVKDDVKKVIADVTGLFPKKDS